MHLQNTYMYWNDEWFNPSSDKNKLTSFTYLTNASKYVHVNQNNMSIILLTTNSCILCAFPQVSDKLLVGLPPPCPTYTPTTCSRWYDHVWLKADYKPDWSIHPWGVLYEPPSLMWPQNFGAITVNAFTFPSHQRPLSNVGTISWQIRVVLLEGDYCTCSILKGGKYCHFERWHINQKISFIPKKKFLPGLLDC